MSRPKASGSQQSVSKNRGAPRWRARQSLEVEEKCRWRGISAQPLGSGQRDLRAGAVGRRGVGEIEQARVVEVRQRRIEAARVDRTAGHLDRELDLVAADGQR